MYADGCVREDRNKLRLALKSDDIEHIEKFKISLESNAPIKQSCKTVGEKKFYQSFVEISDKHMVKSLIKLGCVQNKSLILTFPSEAIVGNNLISHFIRGYFEGDGSITTGHTYKNTGAINTKLSVVGSKQFIPELQKRIGTPDIKAEDKGKFLHLSIHGNNQCLRILDEIIYKDAEIYLDRKYQKYIEFKEYMLEYKDTKIINIEKANRIGKQCKITREDAEIIRKLYASGIFVSDITERFNIGKTQVYRIIHHQRWA